jgi:type IV pilus assembly protein PilA
MLKKFFKNDKGLTLVELLAVIVILGIIAAIAVPSIGGIINKSKEDAKVAEAIQIINAAKLAHASDSEITEWTQTGSATTGALVEYLSNVDDVNYVVSYDTTTQLYSISKHDASEAIGEDKNEIVTETQLTDAAK